MILFIISLGILVVFSIIDVISHRKFKKYPNLIFHIFGISAVLISLAFLAVSEFKFSLLIYPGIILILISLIIIILSYVEIRRHFLTATGIVKKGMYKYSRHPMYSGIVLFFIGLILAFPSFYIFIYSIIAILLIIYQAYEEEKHLARRFPQYKKYKGKTGMFLPRLYLALLSHK
jgi:protein-S-isoprenylcysteine O-methyltransferase Ste14